MVRVLQVYPQINNAGTERVIFNLYENIDRNQVQFDFLAEHPGMLDEKIKNMGGRIYYLYKERKNDYYTALLLFFQNHPEYRIVHTHTHARMGIVLKAAKKSGIQFRIAHSHNYRGDLPKIFKYYKLISGWDIEQYATHFVACSQEAARWLFPRKYKQAVIWNNGIELEKFIFNLETRQNYRLKFGIPKDAKVICHVGRFAKQKNHVRIIEIINKMVSEKENIYAILVGVGPLLEKMKEEAVNEKILFLGNRMDVPNILCAADVFLFPSLYEGLGIVAIEAQASGIKCIASNNVPLSADIGLGLFEQIDLKAPNSVWRNKLDEAMQGFDASERLKKSMKAIRSDYNIKKVAFTAQEFYLSMGEKNV